eukprot:scaffold65349_cov35-Tisochrysis_lutea.AAC.5
MPVYSLEDDNWVKTSNFNLQLDLKFQVNFAPSPSRMRHAAGRDVSVYLLRSTAGSGARISPVRSRCSKVYLPRICDTYVL